MRYHHLEKAVFKERKNRFVAEVEKDGQSLLVHVPNTGRCRELFVAGAEVYIERSANGARKYPYSLVIVKKGDQLVHIDPAGANLLVEEGLKSCTIPGLADVTHVEREKTFARSRFDFRFKKGERICYMEVKGVTLEENGIAMFPDAPTERGARHLRELVKVKEEGFGAYILFVVQMKGVHAFTPHKERDPRFYESLVAAYEGGVAVIVCDTVVTPEDIRLDREIPMIL